MAKATSEFISYRENLMRQVNEGNEQALIELGINIVATAKPLAPVDFGQLRNSINWKTSKSNGGFDGSYNAIGKRGNAFKGEVAEPIKDDTRQGELLVGTNVNHAIYQEFGTRNIPPKPFMRPSIAKWTRGANAMRQVGKIIKDYIKKYPNKAVPK